VIKLQKASLTTTNPPSPPQINSQTKTINTSVQSELNIIANITDNQAIYRCEAQNSATDVPLLDSKTLSVHCEFCWGKLGVGEN
jgi:nephron